MSRVYIAKNNETHWKWLYEISGFTALILGILFLVGLLSLFKVWLPLTIKNDWLLLLQNNWLVILFKLNAGIEGVHFDQLYGLNFLDIAIMSLVAIMYLGLYISLRQTSKILSVTAAILPFLGLVLFITTKLAGRSGIMGAGLVISFIMLRSNIFGKLIPLLGIVSSILLFVGDFGTKPNSPSTTVSIFVGVGYILLMMWFFMIARRLFQLGRNVLK